MPTLLSSAATGSWNLEGGAIDGGTVTEADGAELTFTNRGTLNGVAFDNNLDLATTTAAVTITGGLTLDNANVYLGNTAGSTYGQLDFYGTQTLGGTGTVVFGPNGSNGIYGSTVSQRYAHHRQRYHRRWNHWGDCRRLLQLRDGDQPGNHCGRRQRRRSRRQHH